MDFTKFDHFFNGVAAYDEQGLIRYCNETFAELVGISATRIINKSTLEKLFIELDDQPVQMSLMQPTEPTTARVVKFKTKSIEEGTGQYRLVPFLENKITLLILQDLTLEEKLKQKYHREMASKDQKIEEMKSLIGLLQKTRLVKEPTAIVKEFTLHILSQFNLDLAFVMRPDKQLQIQTMNTEESTKDLEAAIESAHLPLQYVTYESETLSKMGLAKKHDLTELVTIPIRAPHKNSYMVILPLFKKNASLGLDHVMIKTLAEQMSLILENMALEKLSIFDDLTKLYNARFFRERLDEYTAHYSTLSLVLLDIDFFKKINDTYGHLAGDMVLSQMGETLKKINLKDSFVARIGGEEFAVLVPNQEPTDVLAMAENLAHQIRALEFKFEDKVLKVTSSFGISHWQPGKMQVRDFFKLADAALYESKKTGRNRITVHKP